MNALARTAMLALLVMALGLAGCGIKGNPIRPGSEEDPKKHGTN